MDSKVENILEELKGTRVGSVLMHQLLTHISGLTRDSDAGLVGVSPMPFAHS